MRLVDTGVLFEGALEGALALIGGDRGNIQIRELSNGSLRIVAQCGFGTKFLEYFAIVEDDTSACGRAATERLQTVITDVSEDAAFEPHREIAAASRFRAVQSTPLVDPTGRVRGVISTHYRHPHRPGSRDLQLMQWYAERVGAALPIGTITRSRSTKRPPRSTRIPRTSTVPPPLGSITAPVRS